MISPHEARTIDERHVLAAGDRQIGLVQQCRDAEVRMRALAAQRPPRQSMELRIQLVEQRVRVVDGRAARRSCSHEGPYILRPKREISAYCKDRKSASKHATPPLA
jgi:hypothetical protein